MLPMYKRCTWATLEAIGFQIGIYDISLTNMLTTPLSQFVDFFFVETQLTSLMHSEAFGLEIN
jgi:hypothetical protein